MAQKTYYTLLLIIAIQANPCLIQAQDNKPWSGFGIETNLFAGKVFKHSPKFHLPIPEVSTGLDMNFIYQTYGRVPWEQRRHYPIVGVGITYTNYGIDSVYGRCLGIYPNMTIPVINGKKLQWTVRIGDGIGYVSRHYGRTPISDTMNNAIGSHVNDYASFATDLRYRFSKNFDLQAGMFFSHISDASFRQPNLGINLYGAHIGIRYFPVTAYPKKIHTELKPLKNRWLLQVKGSMAFTELDAPQGPLYPVYLASLYASRRWHSKNKMFGGIDYSYHEGIFAFQRNNGVNPGQEAANSYKSAIFAGNEYLMGHVGIVLQVGYYLKQAYLKQDIYYEKLGGNWYLVQKEKGPVKEFFLFGMLKTHKTVAELAEFGIGFGF